MEGFATERLFTAHRMVSGGWWEVQSADNSGRSCLCRLMARKESPVREEGEADEAQVQLSPALLFHLTEGTTQGRVLQPTVSVVIRPYNPPLSFASAPRTNLPSHTSSTCCSTTPLPATLSVTLTRLCTPLSSGHARYDAAITRYFQQRRIVANQQVIAIPLTTRNTYINATWTDQSEPLEAEVEVEEEQVEQREEEEQDRVVRDVRARLRASSPAVVFFRLTSPTPSPYLCIEPGVTSISTEGSINALAPHQLALYLTHSSHQSSSVLQTPLLIRQCSELYDLIAPAASGTGGKGGFALLVKASAHAMVEETVQSVASALGVHYLPLSLFTLLTSPAFLPLSSSSAAAAAASTASTVAYSSVLSFITSCRPCLVHLRHLSAVAAAKDNEKHIHSFLENLISSSTSSTDDSIILVGECEDDDSVSVGVRGLFTHTYTVAAPSKDEREQVTLAALSDEQDIGALEEEDRAEMARVMAGKSAGVSVGELVGVVREGVRLGRHRWMENEQQRRQSLQHNSRHSTSSNPSSPPALALSSLPLVFEPFTLTLPDLLASLSAYTARTSVLSGTLATLPTTRWSDIGGLTAAKRQIQQLIDLPRLSSTLATTTTTTNKPLKPLKTNGGILLFGPPGTGKTLMAKAVAAESGMNFISVKGPELLNMYVGESERNVRNVFVRARACVPCVIFFDELDSLAPRRGGGSDGGGVMDRVVSQLLTEMDGVQQQQGTGGGGGILIIGATNRPDLLDAALMRPGRLDKLVYLGVSDGGDDGRLSVLRALTRKMRLEEGGEWLAEVASRMEGRGYTGADCYGLVTDAMMIAVKRSIGEVREKVDELNRIRKEMYDDDASSDSNTSNHGGGVDEAAEDDELAADEDELTPLAYLRSLSHDELVVQLTRADFVQALDKLVPSLSREELQHYEQIRQKFVSEKGATTGRAEQQQSSTRPLVGTQVVEKAKEEVEERKEDGVGGEARVDNGSGKEELVEEHKDVRDVVSNGTGGHKVAAGVGGRGRRNKHNR